MKQTTKIEILKYAIYTVVLCLLFAMQSSPHLLDIGGMKPNLVLSFCVFVAILEGEFPGAMFGAFGGLFLDFSAGTNTGYYGLVYMGVCCMASAIVNRFLRPTFKNSMLLLFVSMFTVAIIDFLFRYSLRYPGSFGLFDFRVAGKAIYTMVTGMAVFYLASFINNRFQKHSKVMK